MLAAKSSRSKQRRRQLQLGRDCESVEEYHHTMALSADGSDEYLPDSDESEYEDERPNRWFGPSSTWQQLNSAEIDTLRALDDIRNQDLSIHLYNAFALRQGRGRPREDARAPVPGLDINAATGQPVQQDDWAPPRLWAAWPMRADQVPRPGLMRESAPRDRPFLYSKPAGNEASSTALEESIAASILKLAKDRFRARPWAEPDTESQSDTSGRGSGDDIASGPSHSRSKSAAKYESAGEEKMDIDETTDHQGVDPRRQAPARHRWIPVVAADDDQSYALLQPSTRHIVAKVDTTLMILHTMRDSAASYQSDSTDSEASDSSRASLCSAGTRSRSRSVAAKQHGRRSKSRGSSRIRASAPPEEGPATAQKKKRAGRPMKYYPRLEGETDREYTIRVAKIQKKPLPVFADEQQQQQQPPPREARDGDDDDDADVETEGVDDDGDDTNGKSAAPAPAPAKRPPKRERAVDTDTDSSTSEVSAGGGAPANKKKKPRRGHRDALRDWRDVLGAAALAGFPAGALDRAARRCADLFAQSTVLHRVPETPIHAAAGGMTMTTMTTTTTTYVPGMPMPPLLDDDAEDEDRLGLHPPSRATRRALSRGPSLGPESATTEDEAAGRRGGRPRRRSSSAGAGGLLSSYYCRYGGCPRAVDPFSRRQHLVRHLRLVHGQDTGGDAEATTRRTATTTPAEVDSEDEMLGAVHVDGFLRPIRTRPGTRSHSPETHIENARLTVYAKPAT
ncbi:RNA polymerase I-specific transcription initiation factor-domain-containing protein [Xylariaceae sp. FL0804]|nr:RNA polymerase I-specific transcription initiation factor-domain-containing protein [Xylariaceae sp. FL0804]